MPSLTHRQRAQAGSSGGGGGGGAAKRKQPSQEKRTTQSQPHPQQPPAARAISSQSHNDQHQSDSSSASTSGDEDDDDDDSADDGQDDDSEGDNDGDDTTDSDNDAEAEAVFSRPIKSNITDHFPFHLHLLEVTHNTISLLWASAPPAMPLPTHTTTSNPTLAGPRTSLKDTALAVSINGKPWSKLFLTDLSTSGDQAVLVVHGLNQDSENNLVVHAHSLSSADQPGNNTTLVSFSNPVPKSSAAAHSHYELKATPATGIAQPAASPIATKQDEVDKNGLPSPLTLEALRNVLNTANQKREQLLSSLRKARKDASRSESALRNEIDSLQRNLERLSAADGRTKQKILALQENVRQAKAAEERLVQEAASLQAEWDERQAYSAKSRAQREREHAQWEAERVKQEAHLRALADGLREQERRRDRVRSECDDREKRRERMDAKWARVRVLEEELRRLKEEVAGVKDGATAFAAAVTHLSRSASGSGGRPSAAAERAAAVGSSAHGHISASSPSSPSRLASNPFAGVFEQHQQQQQQQQQQAPSSSTSGFSTLRATAPAFFSPQQQQQQHVPAHIGDDLHLLLPGSGGGALTPPQARSVREHAMVTATNSARMRSVAAVASLSGAEGSSSGGGGGGGLDPHKPEFVPTWLQPTFQPLVGGGGGGEMDGHGGGVYAEDEAAAAAAVAAMYGHGIYDPSVLQQQQVPDLFVSPSLAAALPASAPSSSYMGYGGGGGAEYGPVAASDLYRALLNGHVQHSRMGVPSGLGVDTDMYLAQRSSPSADGLSPGAAGQAPLDGEDGADSTDAETVDGDDLDFDPTLKLPPSFARSTRHQQPSSQQQQQTGSPAAGVGPRLAGSRPHSLVITNPGSGLGSGSGPNSGVGLDSMVLQAPHWPPSPQQ
ncbi:hypothetical protein V8E36_004477 [Tilletia maclaganii]